MTDWQTFISSLSRMRHWTSEDRETLDKHTAPFPPEGVGNAHTSHGRQHTYISTASVDGCGTEEGSDMAGFCGHRSRHCGPPHPLRRYPYQDQSHGTSLAWLTPYSTSHLSLYPAERPAVHVDIFPRFFQLSLISDSSIRVTKRVDGYGVDPWLAWPCSQFFSSHG